ncbi:MAG: AEC family transporter [Rhodospirillales bacterium]|nr:AEC family transporter [Rhodospirillales bacterium]
MITILSALAPVFLLIFLGYVLKIRGWVPDAFWQPAEKLTFYLFFPALLLKSTATAELGSAQVLPLMATLTAGILGVAALVVVLRSRFAIDGPTFSSVFQGSFRPNTYVAVAAALALFGDAGLSLIAVGLAASVPLVNFLGVLGLLHYARPPGDGPRWKRITLPVISNPLILACAIGAGLNVGGVGLPTVIEPLLEILGRASLPVGLMAVGAGLNFAAVRPFARIVAVTAGCKLLVLPVFTFAAGRLLGLDAVSLSVCVMYATVPGSAVSYIMARQMGGHGPLMAAIITTTTLLSMVAMPLALMVVG